MKILTPFIKLIGKIATPLPRVMFDDFEKIARQARTGDVILSARPWSLSNSFISGKYKHVGIIHMDRVVEAKFVGVVSTKLVDFCMKKDSICLMRPLEDFRVNVYNIVTKKALASIGAPYDFTFTRGGESYYCSELIEHCWEGFVEVPKRKILGKQILNPNDLVGHESWRVVERIN